MFIILLKEMLTCTESQNGKTKNEFRNYTVLSTTLKTVDTFGITPTTSLSVINSLAYYDLIVLPIATGTACALILKLKFLHPLFTN